MSMIIHKLLFQNGSILISFFVEGWLAVAGNYYPPFSLRVSEELLEKIKYIASKNKRSANKEIEFVLEQYVEAYEKANGEIKTEQ